MNEDGDFVAAMALGLVLVVLLFWLPLALLAVMLSRP